MLTGPAIGGVLSEPAAGFPAVFGGTLFAQYPYFLPNLILAVYAGVVLILAFFCLTETDAFLHRKGSQNSKGSGPQSLLRPTRDS